MAGKRKQQHRKKPKFTVTRVAGGIGDIGDAKSVPTKLRPTLVRLVESLGVKAAGQPTTR